MRHEEIDQHGLWAELDTTKSIQQANDWPETPAAIELRDRLLWLDESVRRRYDATPYAAISTTSLDLALRHLQAANQRTMAAKNNAVAGYIEQAHASLDSVLDALAPWAPARTRDVVRQSQSMVDAMAKEVRALTADWRSQTEDLLASLRTTETDAKQAVDDLTQIASGITEQVTTAGEHAQASLEALTSQGKQAEGDRLEKFTAAMLEFREQMDSRLESIGSLAERERATATAKAEDLISQLASMRDSARKVLEALGADATASQYGAYARQERRAGHLWNGIAVALGILGAVAVLWALRDASATDATWEVLTLKAGSGLLLLTVAGYAGKEAAGHRAEERRAKHLELGLAALDPFLANVNADVDELRVALATQLFISQVSKSSTKGRSSAEPVTLSAESEAK